MLKPVEKICQPDPLVATTSGGDGRSPLTVQEHHDAVAEIALSPRVPEPVCTIFDRARNAFVYAWFSYDLGPLAEAQALFSVEFALRMRLGVRAHKRDKMSNLLEKAIKDGIVKENPPGNLPLAMMFSAMRNEWAHGSLHIHTPAMTLDILRACADLINESFAARCT